MMEFKFECVHEGDLIKFRASGFAVFSKIQHLKDSVIAELEAMKGKSFRIMFDLRGLSALDPRSVSALSEINDYLATECTARKMGTVMDSILAKFQHTRIASESRAKELFETGRSKIFTNPDECLKWLNESA